MAISSSPPRVIERCTTATGTIQLQQRGDHYELISNGVFLVATYNGHSERLLVDAVLQTVRHPRRLVVAGLGVGFSLGAALADPRVEAVTVVELEPCIIRWNRTHLAAYSGEGLRDPRVEVVCGDFLEWTRTTAERFDGLCVDIDNGPTWTVSDSNKWLYGHAGLRAVRWLLHPGGAVSFWSAAAAPEFDERLRKHFGGATELNVPHQRGEPDRIYVATAT